MAAKIEEFVLDGAILIFCPCPIYDCMDQGKYFLLECYKYIIYHCIYYSKVFIK